ncbi:uncharacterized protein BDV17DRAFT_299610 [Aspergillus undulatus]|uniref:uncharacterized protein n=1 Tax=Aspergillus undulatus TaxID=1810928 RepID=UPI003CCCA2C4
MVVRGCIEFLAVASILTSVSCTEVVSTASISPAKALSTLWKRRRGGGSDSDSDSGSSSGSGGHDNDSDSDDSSSGSDSGGDDGGWYTCYPEKNITREAHNDEGYGGYYSVGNGQENSTEGGFTPEGSGTPPRWDNSSGSSIAVQEWEISLFDDPEYISYFGGAAVPYFSGEISPNGVEPERFENLPYEPDLSRIPSDLLCQVPNSNYAYKYEKEFNWTRLERVGETATESGLYESESVTTSIPVYCCCAFNSLCGCDDHHENSNFVDILLKELGLGNSPRNSSNVCAIDIENKTIILVKGTLANGSTKADPTVEYLTETVSTTVSSRCLAGTGNPDEVSAARRRNVNVYAPSETAFIVAWVVTVGVGGLFGMGVVIWGF